MRVTYESLMGQFDAGPRSGTWTIGFRTAVEIKALADIPPRDITVLGSTARTEGFTWDGSFLLGCPVEIIPGEGVTFA